MQNLTSLLLLIKGLLLRVFTVKNISDETPMEAYCYGSGEHYLLIGDDVYQLPDDFTCDEFLALEMKDVHQFKTCPELTRSSKIFEPATFDD